MNSLEFDRLKLEITARLSALGPTTADKLASELNVPCGNVRFALEQLRTDEKSVALLSFGFWDIAEELPRVA